MGFLPRRPLFFACLASLTTAVGCIIIFVTLLNLGIGYFMRKSDLILHPVRFRIMRLLHQRPLTTQEIAEQLPDVAKSSIYRHLKLLLEGTAVSVAEVRSVNGIQEKVYQLQQQPSLNADDMANLSAEAHLDYFTSYAFTLIQDFAAYLAQAEAQGPIDLLADFVGYREVQFQATPEELMAAFTAVNQALLPLVQQPASHGRRSYKFATLIHPNKKEN